MTIGSMIRAHRLGFRWCARLGGWLWIGADGPPFPVMLAPEAQVPNRTLQREHRCWWELSDAEQSRMIELSPALRGIRQVKQPVVMWLGEDGTLVEG